MVSKTISENAGDVLSTALELVTNDRAKQHGDAHKQSTTMAKFWSLYLRSRGVLLGRDILGSEAMMMLDLMKTSRDAVGSYNRDTFVDKAGYAALALAVREIEAGEVVK